LEPLHFWRNSYILRFAELTTLNSRKRLTGRVPVETEMKVAEFCVSA
jgi:hypothetical protein